MQTVEPNETYIETSINNEWKKYRSKEYWDYRKDWEQLPNKQELTNFPMHLDIETTSYCNLECVMCPRTILKDKGIDYIEGENKEISFKLYKKIIDEGAREGLKSIKLQYLGEPLADSLIIERIIYAKKKGIIDVMFNTNCTLLDEEMSIRLLESGIDSVFFSVDSIIPSKFEKIRVGANYETVVKNIKNFMRLKKDYPHIQTRISIIDFPGTPKKEMDDFRDFWLPIVGTVGFEEWVNYTSPNNGKINPDFICSQPYQRMFIRYDGNACPCCFDAYKEYKMGNVETNTIKSIWLGPLYEKLRRLHRDKRYYEIEICKKCIMPCSKIAEKKNILIPSIS